jgi:hypothetical protein
MSYLVITRGASQLHRRTLYPVDIYIRRNKLLSLPGSFRGEKVSLEKGFPVDLRVNTGRMLF